MNLNGVIERFNFRQAATDRPVRMTNHGSLAMAQVEPAGAELARAGRRFGAVVGNGATYKAPIQAIPTTTATWALYNGEPDGGKSYLVEIAACFSVSGTLGLGLSLLGGVTKTRQSAAVAAYSGTVLDSLSGGAMNSRAALGNAVTLANTPVWVPLESRDQVSAVSVGSGLVAKDLAGRFLVRPGCCFALDVMAPVGTTALFGVAVAWSELQLDLE